MQIIYDGIVVQPFRRVDYSEGELGGECDDGEEEGNAINIDSQG